MTFAFTIRFVTPDWFQSASRVSGEVIGVKYFGRYLVKRKVTSILNHTHNRKTAIIIITKKKKKRKKKPLPRLFIVALLTKPAGYVIMATIAKQRGIIRLPLIGQGPFLTSHALIALWETPEFAAKNTM